MDPVKLVRNNAWLALLLANVLVFILEQIPQTSNYIFTYGALSQVNALSMPWTWITTLFIHADILHIVLNMWALLLFCPTLEAKIGSRNFLLVYFAAGLLGNVGFLLTSPSPATIGIGASAAIYGAIAALAVMLPNMQMMMFPIPIPLPLWIAAIFYFLIELGSTGNLDSISHFAHVLGLVAGFAAGMYLKGKLVPEFEPLD